MAQIKRGEGGMRGAAARDESRFLARAALDAAWLRDHAPAGEVAFVTCGYDTAFEDVATQVREKVQQLDAVFAGGPLRFSLRIVDDTDPKTRFAGAVREAFEGFEHLRGRLFVTPLFGRAPGTRGQKGLALREGLAAAREGGANLFVYINLNLKVHASQSASVLRHLLEKRADAVVGTRDASEGGCALGRGRLGDKKSAVWSGMVRAAFPELRDFADQNGPLKAFRREGLDHLLRTCRIDGVTLDTEWLLALVHGGFDVERVGICWRQRPGSKIPFWAVASMTRDLGRLQRARDRGAFAATLTPTLPR